MIYDEEKETLNNITILDINRVFYDCSNMRVFLTSPSYIIFSIIIFSFCNYILYVHSICCPHSHFLNVQGKGYVFFSPDGDKDFFT